MLVKRRWVGRIWADAHVSAMARKIPMVRFRSTSVVAGGYDRRSTTLRLRYVDGDTYDYRDVPPGVFADLLEAPSKGQFVNWKVKPYYRYVRVSRAGSAPGS